MLLQTFAGKQVFPNGMRPQEPTTHYLTIETLSHFQHTPLVFVEDRNGSLTIGYAQVQIGLPKANSNNFACSQARHATANPGTLLCTGPCQRVPLHLSLNTVHQRH